MLFLLIMGVLSPSLLRRLLPAFDVAGLEYSGGGWWACSWTPSPTCVVIVGGLAVVPGTLDEAAAAAAPAALDSPSSSLDGI